MTGALIFWSIILNFVCAVALTQFDVTVLERIVWHLLALLVAAVAAMANWIYSDSIKTSDYMKNPLIVSDRDEHKG